MFRTGWMRLWAVLSAALIGATLAYGAYSIWGVDACYSLLSISTAEPIRLDDVKVVEGMREEIGKKIFCGATSYSTPLTLQMLARRKVVTQISFQWLEPSGWAFDTRETADVLDGQQITVQNMTDHVASYVHKARFILVAQWVGYALLTSIALLLIGHAIAWVRRGFQR